MKAKKPNTRFEITELSTGKMALSWCEIIVDKETGVNYLFRGNGYSGGLTVLLDADGKPVVTSIHNA
jgi:hypothetical protein